MYLTVLQRFWREGVATTSAATLADQTGQVASVVRKDLEMTGTVGTTGKGFSVCRLIADIEEFLGWNNPHDAFLAGVGHLGTALLGCREFRAQGLNIVAAFDVDPHKIGQRIHGTEVLPLEKMASLVQRLHIGIGILTVPLSEAQQVADIFISSGIYRIWNFTAQILNAPPHVTVQREDLSAGLAELLVRSASRPAS